VEEFRRRDQTLRMRERLEMVKELSERDARSIHR
jgi:hypothetical protein